MNKKTTSRNQALRQKYHQRDINTGGVRCVRHSEPFIKCTREELRQMDVRTRKLITIDDRDRVYMCQERGGKGICCREDCVDVLLRGLED